MKETLVTKEFIQQEIENGSLFLKEEYLAGLPEDWIDCITFIFTQGIDHINSPVVILDDEQTIKLFRLTNKDQIKTYIISDEKSWEVFLIKELHENKDATVGFFGGEMLRIFCDKKNIYYKTALVDGKCISFTNFEWQKSENEDCRKIVDEIKTVSQDEA